MSMVRPHAVPAWPLALQLALLLALWGTNAPAADFGRLFHTQAERHALDQPTETAVDQGVPRTDPMARRIDGLLRSSRGRATIWLDTEPLDPAPHFRLAPYPALKLVPRLAPQLRLHVGENWPPAPASAMDSLPRLHIHSHGPSRQ
jgi:hypothetical protein